MSFRVKFFTQDVSFRASLTDTQSQESAVSSVNGRTGAVVLNANDVDIIGATENDSLANADEFLYYDNNEHGNRRIDWHHIKNRLTEFLDNIYLREHQSLAGYATELWVEAKHYLTEHQSLTDYATKAWVEAKGYITSLAGYATEAWVEAKHYLTEHQDISGKQDLLVSGTNIKTINHTSLLGSGDIEIGGGAEVPTKTSDLTNDGEDGEHPFLTQHQSLAAYALKTELPTVPTNVSAFSNDAGYLTSHQSLAGYATESWVNGRGFLTAHQSLSGYATENWVNAQGFLTSHQSLADYATIAYVDGLVGDVEAALHALR